MSVALAFFSWITTAISSLIMLWLFAAGQTVVYIHDTKSHLSRRNFDLLNSVNTKENKKNIIMIFKTYFDLLYQTERKFQSPNPIRLLFIFTTTWLESWATRQDTGLIFMQRWEPVPADSSSVIITKQTIPKILRMVTQINRSL